MTCDLVLIVAAFWAEIVLLALEILLLVVAPVPVSMVAPVPVPMAAVERILAVHYLEITPAAVVLLVAQLPWG